MKKRSFTEEDLYRSIGEIDDRLVSEALDYEPKRRVLPRPFLPIVSTVAAALIVAVLALRLLPFIDLGVGDSPIDSGEPPVSTGTPQLPNETEKDEIPLWSVAKDHRENLAFLSALDGLTESATPLTEAPSLKDGEAKLILRDDRDGTYYEILLEDAFDHSSEQLLELLADDPALSVPHGCTPPPFSVWITLGDGVAISPYLTYGSGNLFYGTLDDYVPEHLPSEDLAAFLTDLIRDCAD